MPVQLKQGQALMSLSLTPLIDVIFQLLLFFIVATRFADEGRELDVPLPEASEAMPITYIPHELFVNITEAGEFFVGGRSVEEAALEDLLRKAAVNNPETQSVRIHADRRVAFQSVVTVVNLCKRAGIRDYTTDIAADPDVAAPPASAPGSEGAAAEGAAADRLPAPASQTGAVVPR